MNQIYKYIKQGIYICYFPFLDKGIYKYRFYFHDTNTNTIVNPIVDKHYVYFDSFEEGVKHTVKRVKEYLKNG